MISNKTLSREFLELNPNRIINGVNFTQRELELISCLLGGKSIKSIACSLQISSRTVENHVYRIMSKIGTNSRDGIIDFIEKSEKFLDLKQYRGNRLLNLPLLMKEKSSYLQEVSRRTLHQGPSLDILEWQDFNCREVCSTIFTKEHIDNFKKEELFSDFKSTIEYNEFQKHIIDKICKPLNDNFNINYFYYTKISNDEKKHYITNNINFLRAALEKGLQAFKSSTLMDELFMSLNSSETQRYCLWTGDSKDDIHNLLYNLNIWNGCTIYNKFENHIEVCGFASQRENDQINNFYINNVNVLKKFIEYFREQSKVIPQINDTKLCSSENDPTLNEISKTNLRFSQKELACMYHLSFGKSMKEIARELNISCRTVEVHLIHIKNKTQSNSRSQLIDFYFKYIEPRPIINEFSINCHTSNERYHVTLCQR